MNIKDLAKLANVSISTVSKILNNKDEQISAETRKKVLSLAKEYNYVPYGSQTFNSTNPFFIGLVLSDLESEYQLLSGALSQAEKLGYEVILLNSNGNFESEKKNLLKLSNINVKGVIWEPVSVDNLKNGDILNKKNIPFTAINTSKSDNNSYISFSEYGYQLADLLSKNNHSYPTFLYENVGYRSEGIIDGLKKFYYQKDLHYPSDSIISTNQDNYLENIITSSTNSIICENYNLAEKLYNQLTSLNISIPKNIVISTFCDSISSVNNSKIVFYNINYKKFGIDLVDNFVNLLEKKSSFQSQFKHSTDTTVFNERLLTEFKNQKKNEITILGSINSDYLFNVDHLPSKNQTTNILNETVNVGGKGANQAVGVARLGHVANLIGKVGNDKESLTVIETMKKENVHSSNIFRSSKKETGKAYIYFDDAGFSSISIQDGANKRLSTTDLMNSKSIFTNTSVHLVSTEVPVGVAELSLELAKKNNALTILKPAAIPSISKNLLKNTDYFVPNRNEAALLSPSNLSIEEQADFFLEQGAKNVVITLDKDGCYIKNKNLSKYFKANKKAISIDTTGGADAFISCFAVFLNEKKDIETAAKAANYAAEYCISKRGVIPALINRDTLNVYVNK